MTRLIPLSDIPYAARAYEAEQRRRHKRRVDALDAARYEIRLPKGCHDGKWPFDTTVGWVLTRDAAVALSERLTCMPNGTHARLRWEMTR